MNFGFNNLKIRQFSSISFVFIFLILSNSLFSAPFGGKKVFTYTQPDGSTIKVKLYGDEFHVIQKTLSGYVICQDPTSKFWCYAKLSTDGNDYISTGIIVTSTQAIAANGGITPAMPNELKKDLKINIKSWKEKHAKGRKFFGVDNRGRRKTSIQTASGDGSNEAPQGSPQSAPPSFQATGKRVGLTLLIKFPDRAADVKFSESYVDDLFNKPNYSNGSVTGSLYDIFYWQSNKRLEYNNVVTAYYEAKNNRSYYTDESISFGSRAKELINEALEFLDAEGFDFSKCDGNSDGVIDGINVFYAGGRVNAWSKGLWPHKWSSSNTVIDDGALTSRFFQYQITDMTTNTNMRILTLSHENGHMICGYPDLYSYDGNWSGLSQYSMMSYQGSGKSPNTVDAYLKSKSGWGDVVDIDKNSHFRGASRVESNYWYRFKNPSESREYFIINNRNNDAGYDKNASLGEDGLAIWHIFENKANSYATATTETAQPYVVEAVPEQADGLYHLEKDQGASNHDFFHSGNKTSFSATTSPSSSFWVNSSGWKWDTATADADKMNIHDISGNGEIMTFIIGDGDLSGVATAIGTDIPSSVTAKCDFGEDAPEDRFAVWNKGNGTLTYSISDNAAWLSCDVSNGTATTEGDLVKITYTTSGLATGTYNATITIDGGTDGTETISVVLTVRAQGSLTLSDTTITQNGTASVASNSKEFYITNTGGGNMVYTIADDAAWLSTTPTSGNVSGETDKIYVNFDATSLTAGTYNATITVTAPSAANSPKTISITFNVSSGLTEPTLIADTTSNNVDTKIEVTFTDNATWRTAITAVKWGSTTLTSGQYSVTAGKLTINQGVIQTASTKNVTIIATGYPDAVISQIVSYGAATQLSIQTQPAAPATNGAVLATQPKIAILDQYGNAVSNATNDITVAKQDAGSWTLGGTVLKSASSGIATFTNLTATSAGAVSGAKLRFTATGLTLIDSTTFNIPAPLFPEIEVTGNSNEITDGNSTPTTTDHTHFGRVDVSSDTLERTFIIKNTGTANLTLDGTPKIEISGDHASDFSVTVIPSSPISAVGSTTFKVSFDPSAMGVRNAQINIENNDSNEDPYNFNIRGVGTQGGFTIATWNVKEGLDQTLVRNKIIEMGPDVILITECQNTSEINLLVTSLQDSFGGTYYKYIVDSGVYAGADPLAFVSRYAMSNTESIQSGSIGKAMLRADITVDGESFTIFGIHARAASTHSTHATESDNFISEINTRTSHNRTIVIGDFNSRATSDGAITDTSDTNYSTDGNNYPTIYSTNNFIAAGYVDSWRKINSTNALKSTKMRALEEGSGSNQNERIDFCFVSSDLNASNYILDAGINSETTNVMSDHKPTWVRIKADPNTLTAGGQHLDSTPRIESSSLDDQNRYIDVTFNEGVYKNAGASQALTTANFEITFEKHSNGSATSCSISSVKTNDNVVEGSASALSGGESTVRIFLSITGTWNGNETIKIHLAGKNSSAQNKTAAHIYNGSGVSDHWSRYSSGNPFASTIRTNFHKLSKPYTLTVEDGTGDGSYIPGASANISATTPNGYTFTNWTTSDGGSFNNSNNFSTTYTMPGNDATVKANFSLNDVQIESDTNAINISEGGSSTLKIRLTKQPTGNTNVTVTKFSGDGDLTISGDPVTLSFNTSNWNVYKNITINAAEDADVTNGSAVIRATASGMNNKNVTANEIDNDHTITASSGSNGSISPTGSAIILNGADKTYTMLPDAGYEVDTITVDSLGAGSGASYEFNTVTANHTISVTFKLKTHTITASSGSNGSISPSGLVSVTNGTNKSFTINPDSGYEVDVITVDSSGAGNGSSYTFNNVTGNHTISVTFKVAAVATHTITASSGTNGSINPTGSITINNATNKTFNMTPSAGYEVDTITVDSSNVGSGNSYTFNNVTTDHTISVTFKLTTHTITASSGSNGSISPTGSVGVTNGNNKSFTMSPATGYEVNAVTVDGASQGNIASYTFNNVTTNHTISVTFKIKVYNIISSASANGSINPTGSTAVNHGDSQSYTIAPASGYAIDKVLVDGVDQGAINNYTFNAITNNHTIVVSFVFIPITHTITASSGANGSVSPTGASIVGDGNNLSFTISANAGYEIDSVFVDGSNQGVITSYNFNNVITDHTISVTFKLTIITHTITANSGSNGSISPTGNVIVNEGNSQSFNFNPSAGYIVDDVLVDGFSIGDPSSHIINNVTGNHTISVSFKVSAITYTITSNSGTNGSISPTGATVVAINASQNYIITPDTGYQVLSLIVDGSSVPASNSFSFNNILGNHTIAVSFELIPITHTITSSSNAGGSISPAGSNVIGDGLNQSFAISPNAGFKISDVLVDGVSTGKITNYTFSNVTGDHTIAVSFDKILNTYLMFIVTNGHGDASPKGNINVGEGKDLTIKFTPDTGFEISDVSIDGVSVGILSEYKLINASANHNISVSFKSSDISHQITALSGSNGAISPSGLTTISDKNSQEYFFTPNKGFIISEVNVDGVNVGTPESYRFMNVIKNHTIQVNFSEIEFNSEKEITSFSFQNTSPPIIGQIINDQISLNVPSDTDLFALVATFTHTGIQITVNGKPQISGTSFLDYRNPIQFNVTAEDGTVHPYSIVVNKNGVDNPGLIEFELPKYSISEEGGEITLKVLRKNGNEGNASVQVSTTNLTAEKGLDYEDTTTTLNWSNGDKEPKEIKIKIIDDNFKEAEESFVVKLSNFIGSNVGTTNEAEIVIRDATDNNESSTDVKEGNNPGQDPSPSAGPDSGGGGGCSYSYNLESAIQNNNLCFWLLLITFALINTLIRQNKKNIFSKFRD